MTGSRDIHSYIEGVVGAGHVVILTIGILNGKLSIRHIGDGPDFLVRTARQTGFGQRDIHGLDVAVRFGSVQSSSRFVIRGIPNSVAAIGNDRGLGLRAAVQLPETKGLVVGIAGCVAIGTPIQVGGVHAQITSRCNMLKISSVFIQYPEFPIVGTDTDAIVRIGGIQPGIRFIGFRFGFINHVAALSALSGNNIPPQRTAGRCSCGKRVSGHGSNNGDRR